MRVMKFDHCARRAAAREFMTGGRAGCMDQISWIVAARVGMTEVHDAAARCT